MYIFSNNAVVQVPNFSGLREVGMTTATTLPPRASP